MALPIVDAISFHHEPKKCFEKQFSTLTAVHVANGLDYDNPKEKGNNAGQLIDLEYLAALGIDDRLHAWRKSCSKLEL